MISVDFRDSEARNNKTIQTKFYKSVVGTR